MSLEDKIKEIKKESAKYRGGESRISWFPSLLVLMKSPELDLLRARESTAASQVSSKRSSGESPQATSRKKRKKAVPAEKKLDSKTPTVDWSRVTEPLGLGLSYQPVQKTRTVTLVLTRLRQSYAIPVFTIASIFSPQSEVWLP